MDVLLFYLTMIQECFVKDLFFIRNSKTVLGDSKHCQLLQAPEQFLKLIGILSVSVPP